MLDNTKIFDTKDNQELNKLLKQYDDLSAKSKDIKTSLQNISDRIKEICERTAGTYETNKYVFSLTESHKQVINVEALAKKNKELWEQIPHELLSIKLTEFKKGYKDLWEQVPNTVIDTTDILSMGTIRKKI